MLNKQAQQDYGDDPLSVRESGKYQEEYVHAFVDKWDELIDWDGRAKAEGENRVAFDRTTEGEG